MRYVDDQGWMLYDYFQWLCEKIWSVEADDHALLLKDLHSIIFTSPIRRDMNRAEDGVSLRRDYILEEGVPEVYLEDLGECTVLEMMIALSKRFASDIVGENYASVAFWFWKIIENLDLMKMSDDNYYSSYVKDVITKMCKRQYDKYGNGSMFPVKRSIKDQRYVEIWYQMNGWFEETYGTEVN